MTTPDKLERAVSNLKGLARLLEKYDPWSGTRSKSDASDLRLLLSERAELLATVDRMRGGLESAAETLEHVMTAMADAGAVPAVGTWRFVTQAAKRARAALATGEEK